MKSPPTEPRPGARHHAPKKPGGDDGGGGGGGETAPSGKPYDPTRNVIALNEASAQRQDDLRVAAQVLTDAKLLHLREIVQLRAEHIRDLRLAEADRLDSIRQVDREDVNKASQTAQTAIATLAATTAATSETLRIQVETTATALQTSIAQNMAEVSKRLSALELGMSEGKGKQAVVDPQLGAMFAEMQKLTAAHQVGRGKEEGVRLSGGLLIAILGGFVSLIVIISAIFGAVAYLKPGTGQPHQPAIINQQTP